MSDLQQPSKGGLLIVFDGIDGAGKTTQLQLAQEALKSEGWPVYTTRNLGGTPIGEELRKIIKSPLERPESTNVYIAVAIQEALIEAIQAEKAKGQLILEDRGPLALAAYELYGSGLDKSLVWPHVERGMVELKPKLTIIYDVDVNAGLQRAKQKSAQARADYFESKPHDYFERVAKGYQLMAKQCGDAAVVIDANQPIEAVRRATMRAIRRALAV